MRFSRQFFQFSIFPQSMVRPYGNIHSYRCSELSVERDCPSTRQEKLVPSASDLDISILASDLEILILLSAPDLDVLVFCHHHQDLAAIVRTRYTFNSNISSASIFKVARFHFQVPYAPSTEVHGQNSQCPPTLLTVVRSGIQTASQQ